MIRISYLILLLTLTAKAYGQDQTYTPMKTIEVTGSAERSITPDEIIFSISIEEYWKEEFEGKKYEDYKTKVEIEVVEDTLMAELKAADITMSDITLKRAGNSYRQRGKDFLIGKTVEIKLASFEQVNSLSNQLKTRGIRNMNISRMKHKESEKIQLEIKVQAIKAARKKAEMMASAVGKKVKDVISIVEIDRNVGTVRPVAYSRGNAMLKSASPSQGAQYENFQKLDFKAQVRVVWEIE